MITCPPHHWLIDAPDGSGLNKGACSKCGATRTWPAAMDVELWRHTDGAHERGGKHARHERAVKSERGQPTRVY